jgi:hypothetical protein
VAIGAKASSKRAGLAAVTLGALAGCAPIYGANFDYPDEPAAPKTSNVLVQDKGWDDDDPMRARIKVIDVGKSSAAALDAFYRATYGPADGWVQLAADQSYQDLCLVRHSNSRYTEFVEVFPYTGSRVPTEPSRYLVMTSRLQHIDPGGDANSCGLATAWIPVDLL